MTNRLWLVVVGWALASGCSGCFGCKAPTDLPGSTLPKDCTAQAPAIAPQKLDILFVIDNSNSMKEEQEAVARELTGFIQKIRAGGGVRQDFHVGVITTGVYLHTKINGVEFSRGYPEQSGRLQPVPDLASDGGVVLGTGSERMLTGDDPEVVAKFARLIQQGTSGSGQETPFEALRLALSGELAQRPLAEGGNAGFLRDGARLLITVLTDEDDCSESDRPPKVAIGDLPSINECSRDSNLLTPVNAYQQLLAGMLTDGEGNRREVIYTAIAPVGRATKAAQEVKDPNANDQVRNIDCPTSNQAGVRHRAMAEAFDPTLTNLDSICQDSFQQTLLTIAELASVSQTLDIGNLPDPRVAQVSITRKDGTVTRCTTLNGLTADLPQPNKPVRFRFSGACKRRADDVALDVQLLCAD